MRWHKAFTNQKGQRTALKGVSCSCLMQQGYTGGLQDVLMVAQRCSMLSVVLKLELELLQPPKSPIPVADSIYFLLLDINGGAMDVHRKGLIHERKLNSCTMSTSAVFLPV
jgi:hypothetical protein